jgi:LCP family protein required for cell wall assembly
MSSGPEPPKYNVYKSRNRLRDRLRPPGSDTAGSLLGGFRRRRRTRPGSQDPHLRPGPSLGRRILKYVALAALGWILLAVVVFFISGATKPGISKDAENALNNSGSLLTGSNVLVLGSDARPKGSKEPGASSGPSRSDSIMLLHVGVGSVRKLSILRDTQVSIPGHGIAKINAAYAYGGAALTIKTVQDFLGNGVEINHLIEVSFDDFPKLIDSLGGIDVTLKHCIRTPPFGGKRFHLRAGERHLNGKTALRFARVRKNLCAPNEDDRARAARQQQVLAAIRSRIVSPLHWPGTFARAPWIAWAAPRTVRSDLAGPGLSALFIDLLTGGSGKTNVLRPSGVAGSNLIVSDADKQAAVDQLLGRR